MQNRKKFELKCKKIAKKNQSKKCKKVAPFNYLSKYETYDTQLLS